MCWPFQKSSLSDKPQETYFYISLFWAIFSSNHQRETILRYLEAMAIFLFALESSTVINLSKHQGNTISNFSKLSKQIIPQIWTKILRFPILQKIVGYIPWYFTLFELRRCKLHLLLKLSCENHTHQSVEIKRQITRSQILSKMWKKTLSSLVLPWKWLMIVSAFKSETFL